MFSQHILVRRWGCCLESTNQMATNQGTADCHCINIHELGIPPRMFMGIQDGWHKHWTEMV